MEPRSASPIQAKAGASGAGRPHPPAPSPARRGGAGSARDGTRRKAPRPLMGEGGWGGGVRGSARGWLRQKPPTPYGARGMGRGVSPGSAHPDPPAPPSFGGKGAGGLGPPLRLGLRYVRGLGPAALARLDAERACGPYRSLADFCRRAGVPRAPIENLIAIGAFDSFGLARRELLWQLGLVYRPQGSRPHCPCLPSRTWSLCRCSRRRRSYWPTTL